MFPSPPFQVKKSSSCTNIYNQHYRQDASSHQGTGSQCLKQSFLQKASVYNILPIQDKCNGKQHVKVARQCVFSQSTKQENLTKKQHTSGLGKAIYAKMFQISSFTVCSLEQPVTLIYKFQLLYKFLLKEQFKVKDVQLYKLPPSTLEKKRRKNITSLAR